MSEMVLVAKGRTAEVFTWDSGKVLKLFYSWVSRQTAEYEQHLAKTVYAAGVKTPIAYDVVEVGGRFGLVYERVEGVTMLKMLRSRPWLVTRLGKMFAGLQAAMHACAAPDLPPMQERLAKKILAAQPLPEGLKQAALTALQGLPENNRVCHGDFHPDNILMTRQGPIVIDWIDASAGHPLGDAARTALLTRYGALPPEMPMAWLVKLLRNHFYQTYIRQYCELTRLRVDTLPQWLGVIAAARLSEEIKEEQENLLQITRNTFDTNSSQKLER